MANRFDKQVARPQLRDMPSTAFEIPHAQPNIAGYERLIDSQNRRVELGVEAMGQLDELVNVPVNETMTVFGQIMKNPDFETKKQYQEQLNKELATVGNELYSGDPNAYLKIKRLAAKVTSDAKGGLLFKLAENNKRYNMAEEYMMNNKHLISKDPSIVHSMELNKLKFIENGGTAGLTKGGPMNQLDVTGVDTPLDFLATASKYAAAVMPTQIDSGLRRTSIGGGFYDFYHEQGEEKTAKVLAEYFKSVLPKDSEVMNAIKRQIEYKWQTEGKKTKKDSDGNKIPVVEFDGKEYTLDEAMKKQLNENIKTYSESLAYKKTQVHHNLQRDPVADQQAILSLKASMEAKEAKAVKPIAYNAVVQKSTRAYSLETNNGDPAQLASKSNLYKNAVNNHKESWRLTKEKFVADINNNDGKARILQDGRIEIRKQPNSKEGVTKSGLLTGTVGGASVGASIGGLMGGVGAIPGAIIGGSVGLVASFFDSYFGSKKDAIVLDKPVYIDDSKLQELIVGKANGVEFSEPVYQALSDPLVKAQEGNNWFMDTDEFKEYKESLTGREGSYSVTEVNIDLKSTDDKSQTKNVLKSYLAGINSTKASGWEIVNSGNEDDKGIRAVKNGMIRDDLSNVSHVTVSNLSGVPIVRMQVSFKETEGGPVETGTVSIRLKDPIRGAVFGKRFGEAQQIDSQMRGETNERGQLILSQDSRELIAAGQEFQSSSALAEFNILHKGTSRDAEQLGNILPVMHEGMKATYDLGNDSNPFRVEVLKSQGKYLVTVQTKDGRNIDTSQVLKIGYSGEEPTLPSTPQEVIGVLYQFMDSNGLIRK